MGDVFENLITLVLWIFVSYYLRSKRRQSENKPSPIPQKTETPSPVERRRERLDPLEESGRQQPKYPKDLDELSEAELEIWEDKLLDFAEASGLMEDQDGWVEPWSGRRYYDFDDLFDIYVHRQGKPLSPPTELVIVEGPSGEQVPVLVSRTPQDSPEEAQADPSIAEHPASSDVVLEDTLPQAVGTYFRKPTVVAKPSLGRSHRRRHRIIGSRQALMAGLVLSEIDLFERRSRRTRDF